MKRMNVTLLIVSVVVLVGGIVVPVLAAPKEGPCHEDAERLCKGVKQGGGRIQQCLKDHEAQLSDACKNRLHYAHTEGRERYAACESDAEKFCKGVRQGGGRRRNCLTQHQADLSPACKAELSAASGK